MGQLPVGMKLPTQRALAKEYGIAKSTVQAIVHNLTLKGLIRTEPGRGTYVAARHASDKVRLGELSPDSKETGVGRMELTPDEAKVLEDESGRRISEMVGLFYRTVRDIFTGSDFLDVYTEGPNLTVIEWSGGPTLREVVSEVEPHESPFGGESWNGMRGLRLMTLELEAATFVWIPDQARRLVLRRRLD